jgi:hypothetical protein
MKMGLLGPGTVFGFKEMVVNHSRVVHVFN